MDHRQSGRGYQVLHNEEDPSEVANHTEPSTSAQGLPPPADQSVLEEAEAPPPAYASIVMGATAAPECSGFPGALPPAEKDKADALASTAVDLVQQPEHDFSAHDDFSDADQLRVGNDGIFMLAFFMAFLFNWIGFCLSFCLTNTIAGRYGAICGFGLSLIKWILIVRFSDYFTGYFNGQYWLWWIFLVL
ncbi:hypothetical protein AAFF_G00375980, partial [Aldrovandia affinis]